MDELHGKPQFSALCHSVHLILIPLIKKKPKPSSVEDKAEVILKLGFNHLFSGSICKLQQRLGVSQTSVVEAHAETPVHGAWSLCLEHRAEGRLRRGCSAAGEQALRSHTSVSLVG